MVAESSEAPFEANIVLLLVLVLHKLFILLVDRVVRQVHISVVFVELRRVGLGGEPRQTFLVDVDAEWLVRGHHHVDAQIKLVAIDEQGVRDVARDDRCLVHIELIDVFNDVDAAATG